MYSPMAPRPEITCVYFVKGSVPARFVMTLMVPGAGVAPPFVPLFDILTPFTAAFGPDVMSMRSMMCDGGIVYCEKRLGIPLSRKWLPFILMPRIEKSEYIGELVLVRIDGLFSSTFASGWLGSA